MTKVSLFFVTTLASASAMAGMGPPVQVPEPGMLGLFATAGVALFLLKKFKK